MKINLKQLALECAEAFDMTKKDAEAHVRAMFEIIGENMAQGHEITIPDFGKFKVNHRPAREGRNPKTGETMQLPAKTVPKFLPAKTLKEAVDA